MFPSARLHCAISPAPCGICKKDSFSLSIVRHGVRVPLSNFLLPRLFNFVYPSVIKYGNGTERTVRYSCQRRVRPGFTIVWGAKVAGTFGHLSAYRIGYLRPAHAHRRSANWKNKWCSIRPHRSLVVYSGFVRCESISWFCSKIFGATTAWGINTRAFMAGCRISGVARVTNNDSGLDPPDARQTNP